MKALKAKWVLPITKKPVSNGVVVIKGKKIEAVLKESEFLASYPDLKARDFGDAIIMPGMVNAHTHLETSIFRGLIDDQSNVSFILDVERNFRKLNDDDIRISNNLGLIASLGAGITTVGTMVLKDVGVEQIRDSGIRSSVFLEIKEMSEKNVAENVARIAQRLEQAHSSIGDLMQLGLAPSSCYSVGPRLFKEIADFSHHEKVKLCIHLSESKPENHFVKYGSTRLANDYRELMNWKDYLWQPLGVSPTKYLHDWGIFDADLIAVHVAEVDSNDLNILETHNIPVISCSRHTARLGGSFTPIGRLIDRKMNFGIGTESLASSSNMDMFEEIKLCLLLTRRQERAVKDITAKLFVEAATLGGAKVLGTDSSVGSLEQEKQADLIVVDMKESHQMAARDPYSALVYNSNESDVIYTMVGGNVLYENGEFSSIDRAAVAVAADKLVRRLTNG